MKQLIVFILLLIVMPMAFAISYIPILSIDDYQSVCITTHNTSGVQKNADSAPIYNVTEDNAFATSINNGAFTVYDTGKYCVRWQCTAASGYEADKGYHIQMEATVDGTTGSAMAGFYITADGHSIEEIADNIDDIETDTNDVETDLNNGVALTAATETQIDNIEGDTEAMDTALEWDGLMTTALTGTQSNTTYLKTAIDTVDDFVDTEVASILTGVQSNATKTMENITDTIGGDATAANQQAILAGVESNRSDLETHGDTNWATATGFATTATGSAILTGVQSNATNIKKNITDTGTNDWSGGGATLAQIVNGIFSAILGNSSKSLNATIGEIWKNTTQQGYASAGGDATSAKQDAILKGIEDNRSDLETHGDANWITAVITTLQTITNANAQYQNITTNISQIKTQGDSAWTTATGFATSTQANSILAGIQDNATIIVSTIKDANTTINANISTTRTTIMNDVSLVLLGMVSNNTNISEGISSVLSEIGIVQTGQQSNTTTILTDINATDIMINTSNGQTLIITRGDSAWTTATGFATSTQATDILTGLQSNATAIITRGDIAWITATPSDATAANQLAILAGILSNATGIKTHGDSTWTTATGFLTDATWATNVSVAINATNIMRNVTDTGARDWLTATGFATSAEATAILAGIQSNGTAIMVNTSNGQTYIVSRGNSAWITATGFQTETNALIRYNNLTNYMALNFSTILTDQTTMKSVVDAIAIGLPTNTSLIISVMEGMNSTILFNISYATRTILDNVSTSQTAIHSDIKSSTYGLSAIWTKLTQLVRDIFSATLGTGKSLNVTLTNIDTNVTGGVSITTAQRTAIANETFRLVIQDVTWRYYNDSYGYPQNESVDYADGTNKWIYYNYSDDDISIFAKTEDVTN